VATATYIEWLIEKHIGAIGDEMESTF
jgi:uncharacterized phage infection (PIP) family protein YhgE